MTKRREQNVVLLEDSDREDESEFFSADGDGAVAESAQDNSSQLDIDKDELNTYIDELCEQSNKYVVKLKDFMEILEAQYGLEFNMATRKLVRQRIADLNLRDRVEPRLSTVNKHEMNSNRTHSNGQHKSPTDTTNCKAASFLGENTDRSLADDSQNANDDSDTSIPIQHSNVGLPNTNESILGQSQSSMSIKMALDESRKKDSGAAREVCADTQRDKSDDDTFQKDEFCFTK